MTTNTHHHKSAESTDDKSSITFKNTTGTALLDVAGLAALAHTHQLIACSDNPTEVKGKLVYTCPLQLPTFVHFVFTAKNT